MATQYVTGASPVTFVSEAAASAGIQRQIPLSLITYDDTATNPVAIANWASGDDLALAQSIVVDLIKRGILNTVG